MQTEYHIFKTIYLEYINESNLEKVLKIYVERPSISLKDLSPLSISETLTIIKGLLYTLERLVSKFGYFSITEGMIGIINSKPNIWIS